MAHRQVAAVWVAHRPPPQGSRQLSELACVSPRSPSRRPRSPRFHILLVCHAPTARYLLVTGCQRSARSDGPLHLTGPVGVSKGPQNEHDY